MNKYIFVHQIFLPQFWTPSITKYIWFAIWWHYWNNYFLNFYQWKISNYNYNVSYPAFKIVQLNYSGCQGFHNLQWGNEKKYKWTMFFKQFHLAKSTYSNKNYDKSFCWLNYLLWYKICFPSDSLNQIFNTTISISNHGTQ